MNLVRALRLVPSAVPPHDVAAFSSDLAPPFLAPPRSVAFVGAGGKTTALFQIARELMERGERTVVVSATTHLGAWQIPLADRHIIATTAAELDRLPEEGVLLVTGPLEADRTLPLPNEHMIRLAHVCRARGALLLIEADGSRAHPLKAPATHEPPIPGFVHLVVVTAGLKAVYQPLSPDRVQRPERFAALTGLNAGDLVTPEALVRLLVHPDGGLKNIPPSARRVVLLNQAESPDLQAAGGRMARLLFQTFDSVLVGSLQDAAFQTFESTAGIILAAGESARLGRPKQLLDWRGEPFVRAVARAALSAGLDPVIAVTGAHAPRVGAALDGLPLRLAYNTGWEEGQASSIRAGLGAIAAGFPSSEGRFPGAAIFLLVDQPQVTVSILRALVDTHAAELHSIVAPLVLDRRANPVLFDHRTFPALMSLRGDVGGRAIFDRYRVDYLPWHDDRLLLDVDTPEQYARLLEDETL